jgi:hypothetical protein
MTPSGAVNNGSLDSDTEERSRTSLIGDKYSSRHPDDVRLLAWNINGLPPYSQGGKGKNERLQKYLSELNPDIICLSEINLAWQWVPHNDRLGERAIRWQRGTKTQVAWYKEAPGVTQSFHRGGCAIIVGNHMTGHVESWGKIPEDLDDGLGHASAAHQVNFSLFLQDIGQ